MRIPTKFNGYSLDGRRLYNDPATATVAASTAAELGSAGAAAGTAAAGSTALATGIAAGTALAAGTDLAALGAGLGSAGAGVGATGATLASVAPAAVQQATQTIPMAGQTAALDLAKQQAISHGVGNAAVNQATNLSVQNAIGQNMAGGIASGINPTTASTLAEKAAEIPYLKNTTTFPKYYPVASTSNATPLVEQAPQNIGSLATKQIAASPIVPGANAAQNAGNFIGNPSWEAAKEFAVEHPYVTSAGVGLATKALFTPSKGSSAPPQAPAMIRPYDLSVENTSGQPYDSNSTAERNQLTYNFIPLEPYRADSEPVKKAVGGQVENMSAMNAISGNMMYPQSQLETPMYSNPMVQNPISSNVIFSGVDAPTDTYSGQEKMAAGGIATGLGGYSDGGRLLKGPGDGVSDSIPAVIGDKQPARLADGEFVVPARIVSELGNGSTEAGARKLYAMMDRVQKTRKKSIGKGKVAVNSKADKHLPA